jgi:hypothetical protein
MPGDVQRLKLLVEPYPATLRYDKFLYGMQKVRGSNPLSSTIFRVLVRVEMTIKRQRHRIFAPESAWMSRPDRARGADKSVRPVQQGESF